MWVGIDFGTTNSCAAVVLGKPPAPLAVKEPIGAGYSFPSSIFVDEKGKVFIGHYAEHERPREPSRYLRAFKLDLGTDIPYVIGEYEYLPEQLITLFLRMFKRKAEEMANRPVDAAVITVPATYDRDLRERMCQAARQAGFSKVEPLVEPIAAAIYYDRRDDMQHKMKEGDIVLVYDLGGGTFDVSLIRKQRLSYEVLGVSRGMRVGGEDFDRKIYEDLLQTCSQDFRNRLSDHVQDQQGQEATLALRQNILKSCRTLKHNLSDEEVEEAIEAYNITVDGALKLEYHYLSRQRFTEMIAAWIDETIRQCQELLQSTHITSEEAQRMRVLMVGGSCRVLYVRESLERTFGADRVFQADDPELAVCKGAAFYGDALERADRFLAEVDTLCQSKPLLMILKNGLPELFQKLSTTLAEQIKKRAIVPALRSWRDKEKDLVTINDAELYMQDATSRWIQGDEGQSLIRAVCSDWIAVQLPKLAVLSDPICEKYGVPTDILRLPNTIPLFEAEQALGTQFANLGVEMKIISNGIIATVTTIAIGSVGLFLTEITGPIGLLVGLGLATVVFVGTRLHRTRDMIKEIDIPRRLRKISLSYEKVDKEAEKMQPKLAELISNELQASTLLSEKFITATQSVLHEALRAQARQKARYVWLHSEENSI